MLRHSPKHGTQRLPNDDDDDDAADIISFCHSRTPNAPDAIPISSGMGAFNETEWETLL